MKTNLNAGTGEPWAGQRRANWDISVSTNEEICDFWGNLGLVPPIGSVLQYHTNWFITNLKAGIGNAWAGQSNASEVPRRSVKAKVSVFWENFGFAPPMGSVEIICLNIWLCDQPKGWDRWALSWTKQRQLSSWRFGECQTIKLLGKFRFSSTYRF